MKWSVKVGRLLGIDVYLHFTFLLLLGFLAFAYWRASQRIEAALAGVGFFVALFGCVLLHELGHALMARRFGVKTRDNAPPFPWCPTAGSWGCSRWRTSAK